MMQTGDKIATLLFWVIATLAAAFLGYAMLFSGYGSIDLWHSLIAAFALIGVMLGVRQCYRSVIAPKDH